jgi:hypothetical protein
MGMDFKRAWTNMGVKWGVVNGSLVRSVILSAAWRHFAVEVSMGGGAVVSWGNSGSIDVWGAVEEKMEEWGRWRRITER